VHALDQEFIESQKSRSITVQPQAGTADTFAIYIVFESCDNLRDISALLPRELQL